MLPFQAEPVEQLKARFPKALQKVWIVTHPMPDRPGLHREHVFDFESGIRLLISRDKFYHDRMVDTHVSASWEINPPQSIHEMTRQVLDAFRSIGGKGMLEYVGASGKGIPHWIVRHES